MSSSTGYSYNALSQLTGDRATGYGYDPVGNRSTFTANGNPTAYAYTVNADGDTTALGTDSFASD
ncbi:MAG TPA: hypothetical protein VGP33_13620 [Chloroflexota bacterium]|nr:hypothetical protein [Chloroflexota bacterium]